MQQAIDINSQQIGYEIIENNFSNLDILKCGFDISSDVNPKTNKSYYQNKKKLEIVAELTTNHQGNTDRLENLILGCIRAGCKIIKFQKDYEGFDSLIKVSLSEVKNYIGNEKFNIRLKLARIILLASYKFLEYCLRIKAKRIYLTNQILVSKKNN